MDLIQAELSLDLKLKFVPKTISDFLKEVYLNENVNERASKIHAFVKSLQDELQKVEAFKRELPICMQLLKDAIQFLKEDALHCSALSNTAPLMGGFVWKKTDEGICEVKKQMDLGDKKNWIGMGSLGLCNADDFASGNSEFDLKGNTRVESKGIRGHKRSATEDNLQLSRDGNAKRAFFPYKAYTGTTAPMAREENEDVRLSEESLLTLGIKTGENQHSNVLNASSGRAVSSSVHTVASNFQISSQQPQQQPVRKQRRCWLPEMHRRFVNALMELGGAQAATPKQIREHMQIDGLSNDEVKSHLQKYRLHIRRSPTGSATSVDQSVAVPNGLWMPQNSSRESSSYSGSPLGPLQLAGNNGETSITVDSTEGDDDGKSDNYSYSLKSSFYKF